MYDRAMADAQKLVIPEEFRKKYPELIALMLGSESMHDEERQYWVNILPIMTPEQIQELQTILENERRQLQAIDEKYAREIEEVGHTEIVRRTGEERQRRQQERLALETPEKREEEQKAEELLREIEGGI